MASGTASSLSARRVAASVSASAARSASVNQGDSRHAATAKSFWSDTPIFLALLIP